MKIAITTTTGFTLCYAIMFGKILNRLSDWNAFARQEAEAIRGCRAWSRR